MTPILEKTARNSDLLFYTDEYGYVAVFFNTKQIN